MKKSQKIKTVDLIVVPIIVFIILLAIVGIVISTEDYRGADKEYGELGKYVTLIDESVSGNQIGANGRAVVSDQVFNIDWPSLIEINPDIVAWIIIPNTVVNYPVVQTSDNAYYLHRSFDGAKNSCGTLFMNTYNRRDFTDLNTIIYGHNMKNGSMLATLNKYKDKKYALEHKDVWIVTPYWERKYKVISAHVTTDGSDTYAIEYSDGEYERHIASEMEQSLWDFGTSYDINLPMVTLSTCTSRTDMERFVLVLQPGI